MIKCLATGFNLSPSPLQCLLIYVFLVAKTCPAPSFSTAFLLQLPATSFLWLLLLLIPKTPAFSRDLRLGTSAIPVDAKQNRILLCGVEVISCHFLTDVWVKSESSHVCLSQIQSECLLHWSCPNMSVPKVNEAMWHCLANFHLFATHILSLRLKEGSFSALSIYLNWRF